MNYRWSLIRILLALIRSRIARNLRCIWEYEKFSRVELERLQKDLLKRLLHHAYRHVPYYRKLFDEYGLFVENKLQMDKFSHLPPLTKDIIRGESKNLLSDDHAKRRTYKNASGGSTGEPVELVQDQHYFDWNVATKLYIKSMVGLYAGCREFRLWGSERDVLEGREKIPVRLRNLVYNRSDYNMFKVDEDDFLALAEEWKVRPPQWVEAYVQSACEFGRFINQKAISLPPPKALLVSAGMLYPNMKTFLEQVFHSPVLNRYGSREVGDIAVSCLASSNLHLMVWNHYVEVLDTDLLQVAAGETGKIYITLLTNYSMPLIRYDIGDFAAVGDAHACPCGLEAPTLESVRGREVNIFSTANGKLVDGEYFTHLFYFKKWVRKFQVIQRSHTDILLKIALTEGPPALEETDRMERDIRAVMGNECAIHWDFVEDIPPLPSGKMLFTISEVER